MIAHPSFSIVIPTYERRDIVCDAVRTIGSLTYVGEFNLVVAIDGSTDGTAEALRQIDCPFPLRIIELSHKGAAHARNAGAAHSGGEIILFLDDDMMCDPDMLEQHARMYRDGADAVTGEVFLDPRSPRTFITDSVERWINIPRPPTADEPFQIYTGQLSVRRAVFEAIGGFDEGFTEGDAFGHEDTDFGVKLLERYDARHCPEAISRQRYMVGPAESMRRAPLTAAADMRFITKYPQFADRIFEQRGRSQLRTRLVYRPLSRIPFAGRILGWAGSVMAECALQSPFRSSRWIGYLFFAARSVAYWSAIGALGGVPKSRSLLILCYHAISDHSADPILGPYGVAPEQFAAQLQSLSRRGFMFVGPDAVTAFLGGRTLPRRAVLLTFDDCYKDLLDVARNILRPRGIPALAFAVTGTGSGTNRWDQAEGARQLGLLSAEELREVASLGVEIGAHSRTHRNMRELSATECETEAAGAREDLIELGLPKPRFFSYPYGATDEGSVQAVRKAGYVGGFGIWVRRADPSSDPFRLPRVPVLSSDKGWRFHLKTSFPKWFGWAGVNLGRAAKILGYDPPVRLV